MNYLQQVRENLNKRTPFTIIGYSFGGVVAVQLAALLEEEGRIGRIILIDGHPAMIKELVKEQIPDADCDASAETHLLCALLQLYIPVEIIMKHRVSVSFPIYITNLKKAKNNS